MRLAKHFEGSAGCGSNDSDGILRAGSNSTGRHGSAAGVNQGVQNRSASDGNDNIRSNRSGGGNGLSDNDAVSLAVVVGSGGNINYNIAAREGNRIGNNQPVAKLFDITTVSQKNHLTSNQKQLALSFQTRRQRQQWFPQGVPHSF